MFKIYIILCLMFVGCVSAENVVPASSLETLKIKQSLLDKVSEAQSLLDQSPTQENREELESCLLKFLKMYPQKYNYDSLIHFYGQQVMVDVVNREGWRSKAMAVIDDRQGVFPDEFKSSGRSILGGYQKQIELAQQLIRNRDEARIFSEKVKEYREYLESREVLFSRSSDKDLSENINTYRAALKQNEEGVSRVGLANLLMIMLDKNEDLSVQESLRVEIVNLLNESIRINSGDCRSYSSLSRYFLHEGDYLRSFGAAKMALVRSRGMAPHKKKEASMAVTTLVIRVKISTKEAKKNWELAVLDYYMSDLMSGLSADEIAHINDFVDSYKKRQK